MGKFSKSASHTVEGELGHNNLFQIFKGNLKKVNNFPEKVDDKTVVDVLGAFVNVNSSP